MKLVVAVDAEWGIGYRGDLLARVRADLKNFKALTKNKVVILGTNTLATFPGGKVLPERVNLILNHDPAFKVEGGIVVHSIEELLDVTAGYPSDDVIVIGGASVYRQLLPYVDTTYVTKFEKSFPKDVYFEDLDASDAWECVWQSEPMLSDPATDTEADLRFRFTEYRRISGK